VIPPGVPGHRVENAVVPVAEPAVLFAALASVAEVLETAVVFVVLASVADVVELRASVDIALAFDVSVPASPVPVDVESSGRPNLFPAFPNVDHYASVSSFVEAVGQECAHTSTDAHATHDLCSIFSNPGPHENKTLGHGYNKTNPGYNNVSDTNDLPMSATTNHPRKTDLHLHQEQHTHLAFQAGLPQPVVPQIRRAAADQFQYLYLPPQLL